MSKRGGKGRKVRVDFRQNRQARARSDDWTRKFHADDASVSESHGVESVRAKGDLSRKRTILVGADDLPTVDAALWVRGVVLRVHGLICHVADEQGRTCECTVRRIVRTRAIAQRAPVTCGDRVWFARPAPTAADPGAASAPTGVIERVEPRRTTLSRREGRERRGREHAIVANAEQILIVASVARPRLKPHLIDRYLIAASKGGLTPIIAFNKCDLMSEAPAQDEPVEDQSAPHEAAAELDDGAIDGVDDTADNAGEIEDFAEELLSYEERVRLTPQEVFDDFVGIGYRCIWTSARTGAGLDALRPLLRGRTTVLSGQSGVGKSSLINALDPGLKLATFDVSAENEKGRHCTTFAQLLPLSDGGFVVDTPGIRQFDLWRVEPGELEALFVEIAPLVPQCRFSDCLHRGEEGCAVAAAVETGQISVRRYESYLKMLEEAIGSA